MQLKTEKQLWAVQLSPGGLVMSTMASKRKDAILAMGIKVTSTKQPVKERKTLWSRLKVGYAQGPLSLLTRCVNDRILVSVTTRNRREVRGCCRGYIVAFDKHMNLAMVDVDETYRNPQWLSKSGRRRLRKAQSCQQGKSIDESVKKGDESDPGLEWRTGASNSGDRTSVENQPDVSLVNMNIDRTQDTGGKTAVNYQCVLKELSRHVNQLFIRGDTVVTVIPVK
ncbi:U7 snRNA-associated Sm-like protein LSm11 [Liolophura sinensis]|uniref:U7 snRNA-associated Sm-like protein LSm11 n=1 Tax=Liolophura sinensis TaxID=3198878 RepID=UPI0031596F6C